jgi:hypothetical protein
MEKDVGAGATWPSDELCLPCPAGSFSVFTGQDFGSHSREGLQESKGRKELLVHNQSKMRGLTFIIPERETKEE